MEITIGSRGSDLALWQANFVKDALEKLGHEVLIKIIVTKGDRIQDLSFDKIEGKGFFTKEIEDALLTKEIDLAVHSHKDLETSQPEGLMIGAVSYRENPTDQLLVLKSAVKEGAILELKENPIVGTSSARRKSQMKRVRPDVTLKDLRGNVPTRINKLRTGDYDAIILATAGIKRLELDLTDLHCIELNPQSFVPAPAQGVLGLQIRENDVALKSVMADLNHPDVASAIGVERQVLRLLAGGCQLPLGVFAKQTNEDWNVHVSYATDSNSAAVITVYDTNNLTGLAERIVADLNGVSN
ncbi:MAG: hydroxymethylbilane synthase [Crocinitomix sp.]|nr:hydroxymethylbilane synthase [Crocinitomix sp.]